MAGGGLSPNWQPWGRSEDSHDPETIKVDSFEQTRVLPKHWHATPFLQHDFAESARQGRFISGLYGARTTKTGVPGRCTKIYRTRPRHSQTSRGWPHREAGRARERR